MSACSVPLPIPADHPAYAGHFPGQPILPGVVLLDAALHVLASLQGGVAGQIKSAKFLHPVVPGEPLTLHYTALAGGDFRFEIRSAAHAVANGAVAFTQTPAQ